MTQTDRRSSIVEWNINNERQNWAGKCKKQNKCAYARTHAQQLPLIIIITIYCYLI